MVVVHVKKYTKIFTGKLEKNLIKIGEHYVPFIFSRNGG